MNDIEEYKNTIELLKQALLFYAGDDNYKPVNNNGKITYIDLDDSGNDKVSFINSNKISDILEYDENNSDIISTLLNNNYPNSLVYNKLRNITSIGKLVNKLFPNKYIDKDIETFVNIIKYMRGDINFKIVKGYDIIKYYDEKNYSYNAVLGTRLGDSCMRYSFCKDYIEFYAINEDNVSLLILMEMIKLKEGHYFGN